MGIKRIKGMKGTTPYMELIREVKYSSSMERFYLKSRAVFQSKGQSITVWLEKSGGKTSLLMILSKFCLCEDVKDMHVLFLKKFFFIFSP